MSKSKRRSKPLIEQPEPAPARIQLPAVIARPAKPSRLNWDVNVSILYGVIIAIAAEEPVSRATLITIMARCGYSEGTVSAGLHSLIHGGFVIALGGMYQLNKENQGLVHQHAERRRSTMRVKPGIK
jgi:hypothetical protein